MNRQEVINELIGLINVINMNKDKFIDGYDGDLKVAINHTIKKIQNGQAGYETESEYKGQI